MAAYDDQPSIEERITVLLAAGGDRQAFRQLVDRYDKRLLYFVAGILGDAHGAFDVLQATWLIAFRKLHTLAAPEAFRVWIYRVAHDQAISELRRCSRQPLVLDLGITEVVDEASEAESVLDNAELVHAGLQQLSLDHRRVLTLRFLEEMSIQEIAEVLGCNIGTVKSRLHYAKLALRDRIKESCNAIR